MPEVLVQNKQDAKASDAQPIGSYSRASYAPAERQQQLQHSASGTSPAQRGFSEKDVDWLHKQGIAAAAEKTAEEHPIGGHEKPAPASLSSSKIAAAEAEQGKIPWFREIGITSDPIEMKRIWSPSFERHYEARSWGETYKGRLAMRSVSRIITGSAVFAGMGIVAENALKGYDSSKEHTPTNPLQYAARALDNTIGKAIQGGVTAITKDPVKGLKAVRFRDTNDRLRYRETMGGTVFGRSLGHEVVDVTFNFASMSFADYMTRYLIGVFDPHAHTKWLNEKGHLDLPAGLKELGGALFKGVTYAAGEDMFVALPYAYYSELQSRIIDKASPGFKKDFDLGKIGTSIKVNDKGEAVGNYNLEGIIDITGRFTAYNIGTKFFRNLYASTEGKILDWRHGITPPPKTEEQKGNVVGRSVNYILTNASKTIFTMLPSAFLFATLRVPSSKKRRVAINHKTGEVIKDDSHLSGFSLSGQDVFATEKSHSVYIGDNKQPWYNHILNPIGAGFHKLGDKYQVGLEKVLGKEHQDESTLGDFSHRWAINGIPYFLYFGLKSDVMSPFLDTHRSDFVLSGFFSSVWDSMKAVGSFNPERIKASFGDTREWMNEVGLAMLKQPSPKYERIIQREMNDEGYKLSNEGYSLYQGQYERRRLHHEEHHTAKEELGAAAIARPTFARLDANASAAPAAQTAANGAGSENNAAAPGYADIAGKTSIAGSLHPIASPENTVAQKQGDTQKNGSDTPAAKQDHVSRVAKSGPFSPADVIQERQRKEPVTATSLLDRAMIMPPSSNAIN
ncbi:MAG TPA: hypothetical protein VFT64_04495 [Rickettsiales bacterium]|nr:hypothetical protein [Rickettsiales bacterium]